MGNQATGDDAAKAPDGLQFVLAGSTWADLDRDMQYAARRFQGKAKLARESAKRHRARGDMVRWRKSCAVARVWEMALEELERIGCPF